MNNYLEAYYARIIRNHEDLLKLVTDVLEKDPSVEAYYHKEIDNRRLISSVVFFKGEEINGIGFHEVPYRWSGCGYSEFSNSHSGGNNCEMPFTAEDVLNNFRSITTIKLRYYTYFKSKSEYLKWCSYLKKHEVKTIAQ